MLNWNLLVLDNLISLLISPAIFVLLGMLLLCGILLSVKWDKEEKALRIGNC